jgi:hypothetical protein
VIGATTVRVARLTCGRAVIAVGLVGGVVTIPVTRPRFRGAICASVFVVMLDVSRPDASGVRVGQGAVGTGSVGPVRRWSSLGWPRFRVMLSQCPAGGAHVAAGSLALGWGDAEPIEPCLPPRFGGVGAWSQLDQPRAGCEGQAREARCPRQTEN